MFWSDELGYWVVSRYADCPPGAARARVVLGRQRAGADHAAVPGGRPGPGRRRVPLDPDAHQRRPAGPHPHPAHRPAAFSPRRVAADGAVRARPRAPLHRRAAATTGRPRSSPRSPGSCRRSVIFEILGVPAADVAAVKAGLGQPAAVHVRPGRRGRAGRHRHRHGRLLALLRGAGRGPPGRAARRLHLRPRAHARPARRSRSPSRRWRRSCSGSCSPATRRRPTCSATPLRRLLEDRRRLGALSSPTRR